MKTLFAIIMSLGLVSVGICDITNQPAATSQRPLAGLIQHEYHIEVFVSKLKTLMTPEKGESDYLLVLRYLKQNSIEIQKPGSIFMNYRLHQLLVMAPIADQEKIETLIKKVQDDK